MARACLESPFMYWLLSAAQRGSVEHRLGWRYCTPVRGKCPTLPRGGGGGEAVKTKWPLLVLSETLFIRVTSQSV